MAKKYNEIPAKDNMKVDNNGEETVNPQEKKEFTKVVGAQPKKRKQSLMGRLVKGVLGPEGLPGIGSYVNDEIVIPAIKNIIVDAVTSGINMVMYGDSKRGGSSGGYQAYSRNRTTYRPNTNYGSRYASSHQEPDRKAPMRSSRRGVEEYVIEERYDAAHVLTTLTESADMYGSVSVADYYDLIGIDSQYTDNTYGWTMDSISRANIMPVRGGYIIKFPPEEVI